MSTTRMERRLRLSGTLIVIGLVLQGLTLLKIHPLAFIAFLGIGTPIVALGILVYLLALVGPANGVVESGSGPKPNAH